MEERIGRQNILNGMKSFKVRCISLRLPSGAEFVHCSQIDEIDDRHSRKRDCGKGTDIESMVSLIVPLHFIHRTYSEDFVWQIFGAIAQQMIVMPFVGIPFRQPTTEESKCCFPNSGDLRAIEGHPRPEGCPP
jgi:hypothetical protein